jgi:hypothetical protein
MFFKELYFSALLTLPFQQPLHPMNPALAGHGAVNWVQKKIEP